MLLGGARTRREGFTIGARDSCVNVGQTLVCRGREEFPRRLEDQACLIEVDEKHHPQPGATNGDNQEFHHRRGNPK